MKNLIRGMRVKTTRDFVPKGHIVDDKRLPLKGSIGTIIMLKPLIV